MRFTLLTLSAAVSLAFLGGAQAMPAHSVDATSATPSITLTAGGCGLGFHRGPAGGCRPNGVVVERPVVVVRRPAVVVRPGCGVRVGPIGVRTPC